MKWSLEKQAEEVYRVVVEALEAGIRGDEETFNDLHSHGYTRYSDLPPYRLQSREEALKLKISLLTQLIDFEYSLENFQTFYHGDVAVACFLLRYRGMAVNDYAFEGRMVEGVARCTVVLEKNGDKWRILHEHLSRVPEGFSAD
ncbi:conserved hypothetical protein [Candidatus Caldarchaeum subterraneum]|uniref:SnoaL-like domain-containing protein n=1 Tax=Caldiarchaeum subterraneum TaxID=311458 RepID=E6N444_CALS0|nr:conserved hypothetical protein [Candidatus Caldarchaeum subterraneum]BAJ49877.1 conserved hypothetical protein [Candidatus Caldarchaeum subterraneum]